MRPIVLLPLLLAACLRPEATFPEVRDPDVEEFDHSFFTLAGGHDGPECFACHGEAPKEEADPTCSVCHGRPPGHYAGACDVCHDVYGWDGAVADDFDHRPFFPTPHEGVSQCSSCHPAGDGNYGLFTCTDCHEHRRSETDEDHYEEGVPDYVYESSACLECHPDGDD